MITTANFTSKENIDLSKEMALVGATDCPFTTLLMSKGLTDKAGSVTINWRERTLDSTADISQEEGFTTETFKASARAEKSNIMEIFSKAVQISGTAQASDVTGINDLFASEINDRLLETKINCEKKMLSKTNYDSGSVSGIRRMKSIFELVHADNIVNLAATPNSVASLDYNTFISLPKKLWTAGVATNQHICMVNADFKEQIDGFFADYISYNQPMTTYGFIANRIQTNYGLVDVVLNRHVPIDSIILFAPGYLRLSFLRKPFYEMLAKDGDNIKGQVLTEMSLKAYNSKAIAIAMPEED